MDDILIDKLSDRVNKLIARCAELERLNHELIDKQQHILAERASQKKINHQIAHTLQQLVRQLAPIED